MDQSLIVLILIGLGAGIGSGLFGIGGGVIIVPALVFLLGFSQHRATGTSLAVLLPPVGIAAVFEYYRNDNVDWKAGLIIALSMLLGAWLGALISNRLSGPVLRLLFSGFLIFLGIYSSSTALKRIGELRRAGTFTWFTPTLE